MPRQGSRARLLVVGDVRGQQEEEAGAQEVGAWDRAGRAKAGQREPSWFWGSAWSRSGASAGGAKGNSMCVARF